MSRSSTWALRCLGVAMYAMSGKQSLDDFEHVIARATASCWLHKLTLCRQLVLCSGLQNFGKSIRPNGTPEFNWLDLRIHEADCHPQLEGMVVIRHSAELECSSWNCQLSIFWRRVPLILKRDVYIDQLGCRSSI